MLKRAAQARFVGTTIGLWAVVRIAGLWPSAMPAPPVVAPAAAVAPPATRAWQPASGGIFEPVRATPSAATVSTPRRMAAAKAEAPGLAEVRPAPSGAEADRGVVAVAAARAPPPGAVPDVRAAPARTSRWRGSAFLFARAGEGRTLAAGGILGGSQIAARATYRLDGAGRLAAAARIYRPLAGRGGEVAAGLDWQPRPDLPLRVSAERRIAIDARGRDAWSLYVAHGFYRERGRIVFDGYGQAGVVGARRRDLFADGALRVGRRVPIAGVMLSAGAGAWGAAQPGAARLDVGPRLAAALPVAERAITVALEGRLRIAGDARPGSGVAMTVGMDF